MKAPKNLGRVAATGHLCFLEWLGARVYPRRQIAHAKLAAGHTGTLNSYLADLEAYLASRTIPALSGAGSRR